MNVLLYGAEAEELRPLFDKFPALTLIEEDAPDVVVCFGGDGTLLAAELKWPGVPKAPIRNSRRGIRCMSEPPEDVIARLAAGTLVTTEHLKLECTISHAATERERVGDVFYAINEFSVHMGRTNSSVRFKIWFDTKPYGSAGDREIIGDGFVVSTPFGSTAYYNQITGGVFWQGIGVALMYTSERTNHVVVPEDTVVRAEITRGPAVFAYDNSSKYAELREGDTLLIRKADRPAILYTTDA